MKFRKERPTDNELRDLVVNQGLSDKAIGIRYLVGTYSVRKWRRALGLLKEVGCPTGFKRSPEDLKNRPDFRGEKNPYFGKKHSAEVRQKMSDNHADIKGDKNPYKRALETNPEKRELARLRAKAMWAARDNEWRKAWSEQLSNRAIHSNYQQRIGRNHKCGHHTSDKLIKQNGKMFYRSSWELELAKQLDLCPHVITYEYEQIRLKFVDQDGKNMWTYTDFFVHFDNSTSIMLEVKPDAICALKQDRLWAQLNWCLDNKTQYAIVNIKIINTMFDKLVDSARKGMLDARKYNRRGSISSKECLEVIGA